MKAYIVKDVIENLYMQLVDSRFSQNNIQHLGIYFCIHARAQCYGYEHDGNTHHEEWEGRADAWYHVIIMNRHRVFVKVSREHPFGKIPLDGYENTSNHESCWRDGIDVTHLGFDLWNEAFANCPEEYWPENRDSGLEFQFEAGLSKLFQFVFADINKDPNDDRNYLKVISNIRKANVLGTVFKPEKETEGFEIHGS